MSGLPPLSLPRASHIPPGRPKIDDGPLPDALFFVFLPFQNVFQNLLRKNIEKNAKVEDFGLPKPSQNPSKMPLKSMSQQTCDLSSIFASKSLCRKSADIDFVLVFPILFACRTLFFKSLLAWIFGPKNLPKTLPKRRPNPLKIDAENVLVFYIDFFTSWPRFGSLLGLQVGAKLAIFVSKNYVGRLCEPS